MDLASASSANVLESDDPQPLAASPFQNGKQRPHRLDLPGDDNPGPLKMFSMIVLVIPMWSLTFQSLLVRPQALWPMFFCTTVSHTQRPFLVHEGSSRDSNSDPDAATRASVLTASSSSAPQHSDHRLLPVTSVAAVLSRPLIDRPDGSPLSGGPRGSDLLKEKN